ncbi:glycosyltransferase family 4 protein [uncultured Psychroserpens sp.]|uniref:glycosyltransferase family 4 protein n=1 Tax=uncultured Psychroserpens sp. TaxID=255436 RepID=UPI0026329A4F|nr:glycosyltransferase family 4 protein [uncultured Psychroserpens sp.]
MKTLAIVTTHPIQYNAPWFRMLAQRKNIKIKVFYTWSQSQNSVKDHTFGKDIKWDIPLLEGYDYTFVENKAKQPGSHHFFGIDCPKLIPEISKLQPDAILMFGWNFKSHFAVMRYFKGKIPIWFRGDSTLIDEAKGFKTTLRRLVLKVVYSYVDKALYVGKANKAYFLKHGLKQNQLTYVPHAIDNNRFAIDTLVDYKQEAKNWKINLGYNLQDLVVLFAGKFEPKKQPEFLIKAIEKANKKRADKLHLLMVGHGPLEKELKVANKENTYIKFLPFQNQTKMPILYRVCSIFCLPSKGPGETWGLAVNEAMASGIPVIVTDKVGCASDLVAHNENGYIVPSNNLDELTTIFVNLSENDLDYMSKNATKTIKKWNFVDIVEPIEQLLTN